MHADDQMTMMGDDHNAIRQRAATGAATCLYAPPSLCNTITIRYLPNTGFASACPLQHIGMLGRILVREL